VRAGLPDGQIAVAGKKMIGWLDIRITQVTLHPAIQQVGHPAPTAQPATSNQ